VTTAAYVLAGKISSAEQVANLRKQLGVDESHDVQRGAFMLSTTLRAQGLRARRSPPA